jgi:hypothetical protein
MDLDNFPTYDKVLMSYERAILGSKGWACAWTLDPKVASEFDESFNHKSYDEAGIPRVIKQPVDFSI